MLSAYVRHKDARDSGTPGYPSVSHLPTSHTASYLCMQARDPIPAFRKFALEEGLMSDTDVKDIEKQIVAEVEEAVKFADESPKPVSSSYATTMVLTVIWHRSRAGRGGGGMWSVPGSGGPRSQTVRLQL